ncbi:MAG TPA: glycosyltransferase family 1 protein [Candidatus Baltobacteraceae bacterium]|jgi:glycosyltransferase involved in cell wall biosynthesis|nr:glycosyltransferase family 1 protein [Candidatus Baltobacteraceae bacterium]
MKVALDLQLSLGTATGIGEYAAGLAQALRSAGTDIVALTEPRLDPWRFDRRVLWDQVVLPARARMRGADLLHCASGTMPLMSLLPCVVTVHDVAWLRVQQHARVYARWYFGAFSLKQYARAAAIAVDSHFSRAEVLAFSGIPEDRVHVVYPGVASDFCQLAAAHGTDPFILVPGTVERRKNLEVLLRALVDAPDARLISVGPFTPYHDWCVALAARLGVSDRVEFRGYVSRAELLALYAQCGLVAVPSRYEGFGYPAAQALCSGTPLVVSNAASLAEIAGQSAVIVDVDDHHAWAAALQTILRDPAAARETAQQRRACAVARFSWATSAQAMLGVYNRALSAR